MKVVLFLLFAPFPHFSTLLLSARGRLRHHSHPSTSRHRYVQVALWNFSLCWATKPTKPTIMTLPLPKLASLVLAGQFFCARQRTRKEPTVMMLPSSSSSGLLLVGRLDPRQPERETSSVLRYARRETRGERPCARVVACRSVSACIHTHIFTPRPINLRINLASGRRYVHLSVCFSSFTFLDTQTHDAP